MSTSENTEKPVSNEPSKGGNGAGERRDSVASHTAASQQSQTAKE